MQQLPERIEKALERLRKIRKHYVDLKIINGRCYVYESTSKWDKKGRRVQKITTYIGRITESGEFIPANPRNPQLSAAIIKTPESQKQTNLSAPRPLSEIREDMGKYDAEILTGLSTDGRITLPQLAKKIGLSTSGAEWQRNNVEKRYGIKYLAEIDITRMGYLAYIILIKFESEIPSAEEIKRAFDNEPAVQLVMQTRGDYDIFMYIIVENVSGASLYIYELMKRTTHNYEAEWYVVPTYVSYNFVPLRDRFFEIMKNKIWTRSKESPRPKEGQLLNREYAVLNELNKNGIVDFTEIDKRYDFEKGRAQYTYHKLIQKGILKRITINMQNVSVKYIGIIFTRVIKAAGWERGRKELFKLIISDPKTPINRYSLVSDIGTPYGAVFLLPVFSEGDMEESERTLARILNNIKIRSLVVTNIVIGALCNRRLDKKQTRQYQMLVDLYKIDPERDLD